MNLIKCKDQSKQTLEEFFTEISNSENRSTSECGKAMLSLISKIKNSNENFNLYCLTSHLRIVLLAENSTQSEWFVTLSALDENNYYIEYKMPKEEQPWPFAQVIGEASNVNEALEMTIIAINKSQGWVC